MSRIQRPTPRALGAPSSIANPRMKCRICEEWMRYGALKPDGTPWSPHTPAVRARPPRADMCTTCAQIIDEWYRKAP